MYECDIICKRYKLDTYIHMYVRMYICLHIKNNVKSWYYCEGWFFYVVNRKVSIVEYHVCLSNGYVVISNDRIVNSFVKFFRLPVKSIVRAVAYLWGRWIVLNGHSHNLCGFSFSIYEASFRSDYVLCVVG